MVLRSKQLIVLDFIKKFIAEKGYAPTIREIMAGLCLKSPSTVQSHLQKLVTYGLITIDKNKSRTIELLVENEYLSKDENVKNIPLLNKTIEEINKEFIQAPAFMLDNHDIKNLFAFKHEKSIFIIDIMEKQNNKPSVTTSNEEYYLEEKPLHKVYGNIISEFKLY